MKTNGTIWPTPARRWQKPALLALCCATAVAYGNDVVVKVVGTNNLPLPGAEIIVSAHGATNAPQKGVSDTNGSCVLSAESFDGDLQVDVRMAGMAPLRLDAEAGKWGPLNPLFFKMQPAANLAGTVVDPSGKPLSGARLSFNFAQRLSRAYVPVEDFAVVTDKDGKWSADFLPADAQALRITATQNNTSATLEESQIETLTNLVITMGAAPAQGGVVPGGNGTWTLTVDGAAVAGNATVTIVQGAGGGGGGVIAGANPLNNGPGIEIHGMVLSPDGKPVAGATVFLGMEDIIRGAMRPPEAVTDNTGKFTLNVTGGAQVLVAAFSPDFGPVIQSVPTAKNSPPAQLKLTAPKTYRIKIVDVNGKPSPNATARVSRWSDFNYPPPWQSYVANTEGMIFITNGPPAAGLQIQAFSADRNSRGGLFLTDPAKADNVTITLDGTIVAPAGRGGRGGRRGGRGGAVDGPPVMIEGIVRGPDGKPVAGATVYQGTPVGIRGMIGPPSAVTDSEGKFKMMGDASGDLQMAAFSDQFGPVIRNVFLAPTNPAPVEFQLRESHSLKLRIIGTDGKPLAGVVAKVDRWETFNNPPLWQRFESDLQGRITITNMPGDEINMSFEPPAKVAPADAAIQAIPLRAAPNEVILQLSPNGEVIKDSQGWMPGAF